MLTLGSDDFALYGLPRRQSLDPAEVVQRWRELQTQVHPDRHAAAGQAAQRLAMQWSVRVNEARRRLADPLRRAAYLCELAGVPIDAEHHTAMPAEVLQQQMAWREALDDATTLQEVQSLLDAVSAQRAAWHDELASTIDARGDFEAAAAQVRRLMFVDRSLAAIDARLATFDTTADAPVR